MKTVQVDLLVTAKCVYVPNSEYFFVENGDPQKHIRCHHKQGGRLDVTPRGTIVLREEGQIYPPCLQDEVVLIRLNQDPKSNDYTKAALWATKEEWAKVNWARNARVTYRATAYGHRNNGRFQSNTSSEIMLVTDRLLELVKNHPRTGNKTKDILESGHSSTAIGITFSYQVRWERMETNGSWTDCDDPRPIVEEPKGENQKN